MLKRSFLQISSKNLQKVIEWKLWIFKKSSKSHQTIIEWKFWIFKESSKHLQKIFKTSSNENFESSKNHRKIIEKSSKTFKFAPWFPSFPWFPTPFSSMYSSFLVKLICFLCCLFAFLSFPLLEAFFPGFSSICFCFLPPFSIHILPIYGKMNLIFGLLLGFPN